MEKNDRKKEILKSLLISLIIAAVVLGAVIAFTFWFQGYKNTSFNPTIIIVSDIIGFIVVFFISFMNLKPKKEYKEDTWGVK